MSDYPVILYVEDDARSRRVLEMLARNEMGLHHVTIFDDSENFLARAAALHPKPDVILLDIHVRPHNGFEMLSQLRTHPDLHRVPVMALTASVMNEEIAQLRNAGFNGVIAKPVDMDMFPELLGQVLNGEEVWSLH